MYSPVLWCRTNHLREDESQVFLEACQDTQAVYFIERSKLQAWNTKETRSPQAMDI